MIMGQRRRASTKQQKIRAMKRRGFKGNSQKLAGCLGKIRYATYSEALEAAGAMVNAHAYKCDFCNYYHKGRKS